VKLNNLRGTATERQHTHWTVDSITKDDTTRSSTHVPQSDDHATSLSTDYSC